MDRPDDMTSRWSGVNPGSLSAFEGIDGERRPWVLLELKDFAILSMPHCECGSIDDSS